MTSKESERVLTAIPAELEEEICEVGVRRHPTNVDRERLVLGIKIFPGGVGKTNTPDEFTSLFEDITTRLFTRRGDDTIVSPGHGDSTTLGAERPHLLEWRTRGW